jgi:hypothetical protein
MKYPVEGLSSRLCRHMKEKRGVYYSRQAEGQMEGNDKFPRKPSAKNTTTS